MSDQHGSITLVTNSTGTPVDAIVYDAYGNIASQTSSAKALQCGFHGMQQLG